MKKILYLLILPLLIIGCGTNSSSTSSEKASVSTNSTNNDPKPNPSSSTGQKPSIEKLEGYIYDEQDLINIKNDLAGTYYLANDIFVNNEWTTIGDKDNPFTGTIEGNGYTIRNLKILKSLSMTEEPSSLGRDFISTGGFIGYLKGTINNLNVQHHYSIEDQLPSINNFNSNTTEYKVFVGGLVGINNGTISNCVSDGTVHVSSTSLIGRGRLGGLVGKNEGIIINCESKGMISGKFTHENIRAGGLVGASEGGTISISSSSANIEITNQNGKAIAGGLVGLVQFSEITNCYATGSVGTKSNRASTAGGLIGLIDATVAGTTKVDYCYATGELSATATEKSSYAGGIVGNCEVLISGNKLVGDVIIENCMYAGGKMTSRGTYKAHGGAIISCIEGNTSSLTISLSNCSYLKTVNILVNGTADSKTNSQGKGYSSISEVISAISWDSNIWKIEGSNLPIFK